MHDMEAGIISFLFACALIWFGYRASRGGKRPDGAYDPPKPFVIDGPIVCEECGYDSDHLNLLFTGQYVCEHCELMLMGD